MINSLLFWQRVMVYNYYSESMLEKSTQIDIYETRAKGGSLGIGKVVKGALNQAPIKIKVSSIPHKMQNVVYRSNSQPAFGDSTRKFYHPSQFKEQFFPGPGVYDGKLNFSKVQSSKGSGAFASSTVNFRLMRSRSHVPGPGSYQVQTKMGSKVKNRSTKSSSTSFMSSTVQSTQNNKAHNLFKCEIKEASKFPGPGFYNISGKINQNITLHPAFDSNVKRFMEAKNENPPVGRYEVSKSKSHSQKNHSNHNNHNITQKLEQRKQKMESNCEERKKKLVGILSKFEEDQKIGPGSYNPVRTNDSKGFTMKDNMYDRFGNLNPIYAMAKTIGVEGIELDTVDHEPVKTPKKGMTSMFKSKSKRSEVVLNQKMDPALYKIERAQNVLHKKSHHINFSQKWM